MSTSTAPTSTAPTSTAPTSTTRNSTTTDAVGSLRQEIDALDRDIIELLRNRARLSAHVQRERVDAGGVRLALGRELQVVETYRESLGVAGGSIADAVLRFCRGPM